MKADNLDNDKKSTSLNAYTGCVAFPDGQVFYGPGYGAEGINVAELCFNTSMTGYQEILTDLSYAGQIINFTFPHIGNTGTNIEDNESKMPVALGMISRNMPTNHSSWRSEEDFRVWLKNKSIIGVSGLDTRRITRIIRSKGAQNVAICHLKNKKINAKALVSLAKNAKGLLNTELTESVTCPESYKWYKNVPGFGIADHGTSKKKHYKYRVVAIDYGAKDNIFNCLTKLGCEIIIVPARASYDSILDLKPDGIFLSNGPGDPMATYKLSGNVISSILTKTNLPIFGICLGHQILGLALGAKTIKMPHGHHGANHPVKNKNSGKVEITSMNHGFAIDSQSLPSHVFESHVSLFDSSNCGIEIKSRNAFSVQYHPEASPGPMDSYYLFEKFFELIKINSSLT